MRSVTRLILSSLLLLTMIVTGIVFLKVSQKPLPSQETEVLGEEVSEISQVLSISGYKVVWFVADGSRLSLFPNFEDKTIFDQLVSKYNCMHAVNGSFYDIDSSPLGYFSIGETLLSERKESRLLNGTFSVNYFDTPRITRTIPRDELKFGFQSGPLIIENDSIVPYFAETDKKARRMVVAVTGTNEAVFIAIYTPTTVFDGPKLEELADILTEFEEQTDINIADALNLDGGSASAFYSGDLKLREISPVGSILCVQ